MVIVRIVFFWMVCDRIWNVVRIWRGILTLFKIW
jgi:hypothetical protein